MSNKKVTMSNKPVPPQDDDLDINSWLESLGDEPQHDDVPDFLSDRQPVKPPKPVTPPPPAVKQNSKMAQMLAEAGAEVERLEGELETLTTDRDEQERLKNEALTANRAFEETVKRLEAELQSAINQRDEATKEMTRLTTLLKPLVQPFIVFLTAIGYKVEKTTTK